MKSFTKNIFALGITSVLSLSLSLFSYSHAATYRVIDKNAEEDLGFTYGGKLNNDGNMAVSGYNLYNFPVQFDYLDDDDFVGIVLLALTDQSFYSGLGSIEDLNALTTGNPTAHDLVKRKLACESFSIVSALSGLEGLTRARSMQPDLILLDILMPGKDG